MKREEFLKLYEKYLRDECSAEELQKLFAYEDDFELNLKPWNDPIMGGKEEVRWRILQGIASKNPTKSRILWSVGLSLLLLIVVGYIIYTQKTMVESVVTMAQTAPDEFLDDVMPGSDKAILFLGDGKTVVLDSVNNGLEIDQASALTVYENGQLRYEAEENAPLIYNAIATPKGGQYKLRLSDGTKVWLNADSYFRFPVSFKGDLREVELRGEGYFEVKSNREIPFVVKILHDRHPDTRVNVLGTSFNVNAYENEQSQSIALVEGELLIETASGSTGLKPGELLEVGENNKIVQANLDVITAWKDNRFQFEDESLKSILKQVERWYDVEVIYDQLPNERFYGIISRDVPLSQVIKMLELSSKSKFEIKNKQLLVK